MKFGLVILMALMAMLVGSIGCIEPPPRTVPVESDTYLDLAGRFSVPIPTGWTAAQAYKWGEHYGILTSPEGGVTVHVMAVEAETVEEGVRAAWAIIDPGFNLEPEEVVRPPVTNGVDDVASIVYDTGSDEEFVLAGGWLHQGVAYVEIFRGNLIEAQKLTAQLQIVDTGFTIHALLPADLASAEPLPITPELLAGLEAYVIESMNRFKVPGLAVSIVKDGEIVYARGFGVREMGGTEPVTPETLMLIGSTTKTMTTMLMAELVDEGVMDWDTPVVDILPSFAVADPEITKKIAMKHLVCACTGVPRRDLEWVFNASTLSAEEVIESLADFEFFTGFGEAFQYSNQMVAAGGYIAALAAGGEWGNLYNDYVSLMQKRIFDPIGMASTTFSFDEARASGDYGIPHRANAVLEYGPTPLEVEETMLTPVASAGAAWSNVMDMARYLITELNDGVAPDGTRVVSVANLGKTWEPQVSITSEASYGLGWVVDQYKGLPALHHGGNTFGFTSDLAFFPTINLGISVLTNQQGCIVNELVRFRLLELLYEQKPEADEAGKFYLEMIEKETSALEAKLRETIEPESVESYLGRYAHSALGEVTLEWRDGKLIFDAGEFQSEIRSMTDDEGEIAYFLFDSVLAGLNLELERDEAGNPMMIVGVGVNEYTFERAE